MSVILQKKILCETIKLGTDENLSKSYSYLLGSYLGDGYINLITNKRSYKLRISCDSKYLDVINRNRKAITNIFRYNKVNIADKYYNDKLSSHDIMVHSNHIPELFPQWKGGVKHKRKIELENWQLSIINNYLV